MSIDPYRWIRLVLEEALPFPEDAFSKEDSWEFLEMGIPYCSLMRTSAITQARQRLVAIPEPLEEKPLQLMAYKELRILGEPGFPVYLRSESEVDIPEVAPEDNRGKACLVIIPDGVKVDRMILSMLALMEFDVEVEMDHASDWWDRAIKEDKAKLPKNHPDRLL